MRSFRLFFHVIWSHCRLETKTASLHVHSWRQGLFAVRARRSVRVAAHGGFAKRDTKIFEKWERSCVLLRKDLKPTPMLVLSVRSTAGTDEDPQNSSGPAPFHSRSPQCQLSHSGFQATPIPFLLVKSDLIDDAGVGYFLGATFFFPSHLPSPAGSCRIAALSSVLHLCGRRMPKLCLRGPMPVPAMSQARRLAIISSPCGCTELCARDAPSIFYMLRLASHC